MALVHVKKKPANVLGEQSWQLRDPTGAEIVVFTEFCKKLKGLALASRRAYTTAVSRFIDYLYEVQILGGTPVSRSSVNTSIDYYLELLRTGEKISLAVHQGDETWYDEGDELKEARLRAVARRLGIKSLASGSWDNNLAGLNRFLNLCKELEQQSHELALLKGGVKADLVHQAEIDYRPLLEAVDGVANLSRFEVNYIKQSTMLGGVIRFRGNDLARPKGLRKSSREVSQVDVDWLDFPEEHFEALLVSATTWRDRALWSLLHASGLRRSEGLNLQWCDIDFIKREVFVLDPNLLRYGRDITPEERERRFKGRTVSWTYLRQPYKDWFFEYLMRYRREEYHLPNDDNDFVFQYLIAPHYGRPLYQATDETLNSTFTDAVKRAGIPGPPVARTYVYTVHSLRHAFGRFVVNDFPVAGQAEKGLTLAEAQLMLGHKDVVSTRRYARKRTDRLKEKLLKSDAEYADAVRPAPCLPPPNVSQLNLA